MRIKVRDESETFTAIFWSRTIDNVITGICDWFNETEEELEYGRAWYQENSCR